jgi:anti-anti-sigma factor
MYDISKVDDISILHLYGEISLLEMELIQKLIASLKKNHHTKILIDLAKVDHVHFQAVQRWADEALVLQAAEGDLKIASPNPSTRQVLQFVGADQHLKDYASISEAILSFLRSPKSLRGCGFDEVFGDAQGSEPEAQDRWNPVRRKKNPEAWLH